MHFVVLFQFLFSKKHVRARLQLPDRLKETELVTDRRLPLLKTLCGQEPPPVPLSGSFIVCTVMRHVFC